MLEVGFSPTSLMGTYLCLKTEDFFYINFMTKLSDFLHLNEATAFLLSQLISYLLSFN